MRSWIASVLGATTITGPDRVYRAKDWGTTAAFVVPGPSMVVFHACRLPLFDQSPVVHRLLAAHCQRHVPTVLGATERPGQTWTLFGYFDGTPVGSIGTPESLVEVARTIAEVQAKVATLPADRTASLPSYALSSVPTWGWWE